ncbi:hypothetical protein RO3G_03720 [Rhizopus delemar RA 99-880]|uniref:Uncharacterized protein n=1 Tax=Rhizopus delemar (strain RA 99-880 / ATCC MYA-4621 / FGSC 9543 / NRRL 43880) TaxID=246409 RepID=I1BS35_RHIO9|nr:hypothetical protein RO3G_03720 [Rhizopus delemar RA 99-880]|eukprot:EIE79015.1 hypothetical protein RO3G_03720 [Rhizopus delemar RA 99-880]
MAPVSRGRKASKPILSNEQIQILTAQFNTQRRRLVCTNCKETNSFYRNGSIAGDPPQPCFVCKSCGKTYSAPTMAEICELASTTTMLSQPLSLDTMMETSNTQDDNPEAMPVTTTTATDIASLQATIERLCAELKQTQAELKQARTEIDMLRNQRTQNLNQSTIETHDTQFPSLPSTAQSLPPWKDTARLNSIKQSMLEKRQQRRIQRQENAARFLQPPSENQGFQYIYIPTKARVPIGQLRNRLRRLDINNSRILDINYPTRNIVALLVHNDYAPELKAHLQKFKVTVNENFNPCDGSILMDPKYEQNTKEERDSLAFMHHCDRMKRAINYIRVPVKTAVARYFYNQGWIDKQTFTETLTTTGSKPTDVFYVDQDADMNISDLDDNISQL